MSDAVLHQILTLLAPLFLEAAQGDQHAASNAARAMLDSYEPRTDRERRLAALAIAFGFGALDALGKAADPAADPARAIRLRNNANALHRSAETAEKRLDALRQAPPQDDPAADPVPLPDSAAANELLAFAKSAMKAMPPLTRQQRRAAERMLQKARRQGQDAGRQPQGSAAA